MDQFFRPVLDRIVEPAPPPRLPYVSVTAYTPWNARDPDVVLSAVLLRATDFERQLVLHRVPSAARGLSNAARNIAAFIFHPFLNETWTMSSHRTSIETPSNLVLRYAQGTWTRRALPSCPPTRIESAHRLRFATPTFFAISSLNLLSLQRLRCRTPLSASRHSFLWLPRTARGTGALLRSRQEYTPSFRPQNTMRKRDHGVSPREGPGLRPRT